MYLNFRRKYSRGRYREIVRELGVNENYENVDQQIKNERRRERETSTKAEKKRIDGKMNKRK